jgi:uncharacterized membrane protein
MSKLILGVLLWSFAHLIPASFTGLRKALVSRLGENGYKGVFTLLMVLAIYLVISGWKATVPETVYVPFAWGRHVTALNRRDGAWTPPAAVARKNDFVLVAAGLVAYVIAAAAHQWLFGFSPFVH